MIGHFKQYHIIPDNSSSLDKKYSSPRIELLKALVCYLNEYDSLADFIIINQDELPINDNTPGQITIKVTRKNIIYKNGKRNYITDSKEETFEINNSDDQKYYDETVEKILRDAEHTISDTNAKINESKRSESGKPLINLIWTIKRNEHSTLQSITQDILKGIGLLDSDYLSNIEVIETENENLILEKSNNAYVIITEFK